MLDRRAVKMNLANEGFEARKKEEEVTAKKRKAEDDARWEGMSFRTCPAGDSHPPPSHRNTGTARGQLAYLHQYIEKEEKGEGRRSWLRSCPVPASAQRLYLSISCPGN